MGVSQLTAKLRREFPEEQAHLLAESIVETVEEAQKELVKAKDFNELKEIVKRLADAQERLTKAQERLTKAQEKTEISIQKLSSSLHHQLGGLSRSFAYSLENEAYRVLPQYLKEHHQIEVSEKFIRKFIEGEEINFLAKGRKDGKEIVIVGESTLRLDDMSKFGQLEKKLKIAILHYKEIEVIPIMITHFATDPMLTKAQKTGIIVIQSFEWA